MKPSLKMPMRTAFELIAEANNAHDMAQIICEIAECAFQLGYQLGRKPTPKLRQIAPGIHAMELQDCEELANVLAGLDRGDDRMSSYSTKAEAEDAIKRHTPQSKRTKLGFI